MVSVEDGKADTLPQAMTKAIESPDIKALRKVLQDICGTSKNFMHQCIHAGELLTKIKAKTKYGDWKLVLESVELTDKTATRYMWFWEHRATIDVSKIKTLAEATQLLLTEGAKTGIIPGVTSKNEPLTHEKASTSQAQERPDFRDHAGRVGPTRSVAGGDQKTGIKGGFQADEVPRDNSRAYLSGNGVPQGTEAQDQVKLDKVGRPIPAGILPDWERAYELGTRFRSMVSEIKCALQKGIDHDDIFCEVRNGVITEAAQLFASLEQLLPYSVCHNCQGETPESCDFCNHRGFYSNFMFQGPSVGDKFRKMMQASARQYAS